MKVKHIISYPDADFCRDINYETLMVDDKLALHGDWYHDRIEIKIGGFLDCLKFLNIEHEYVLEEIHEPNGDDEEDEEDGW